MRIENYTIRKAAADDFGAMKNLLELVKLPVEGVFENIEHFLVMENKNSITGLVGLEVFGTEGLLRSMAVLPALQGKGKGSKLYNAVINYSRELKLTHLYLLTETAEKFFKQRGFEIVDRNKVGSAMKESVEFKSLCPDSATCMYKKI